MNIGFTTHCEMVQAFFLSDQSQFDIEYQSKTLGSCFVNRASKCNPLFVPDSQFQKVLSQRKCLFFVQLKHPLDFHFQYLQQELIRQERQRILNEYRSGKLSADTVISPDLLGDEDIDEDDLDDVRKLRLAAAAMQKSKTQKPPPTSTTGGNSKKQR